MTDSFVDGHHMLGNDCKMLFFSSSYQLHGYRASNLHHHGPRNTSTTAQLPDITANASRDLLIRDPRCLVVTGVDCLTKRG